MKWISIAIRSLVCFRRPDLCFTYEGSAGWGTQTCIESIRHNIHVRAHVCCHMRMYACKLHVYIYISICMHVNCMYACKLHVCTYMYILITVIRITVAIHAINWLPYIVHTWSLRIPPYKTNCMNIFYLKVFWGLIPTPATCIETVAKKWRATETAQTHRK